MSGDLWTEIAAKMYTALRVSDVQNLRGNSVACLSNPKSRFIPHSEHNVRHDKDETNGAVSGIFRLLF